MAKKLNVHEKGALYDIGWFPVPTYNKYVHRNVSNKMFKLKRLKRTQHYRTQLYFSLTPRCLKLFKTKIPKALRLDICFKKSEKMSSKHCKLREDLGLIYAQFIYNNFLKRDLLRDRNKFILDLGL